MTKSSGIGSVIILSVLTMLVTAQTPKPLIAKYRRLDCLGPTSVRSLEDSLRGDLILCRERNGKLASINTREVTEIEYDFISLQGKPTPEDDVPSYATTLPGVFIWPAVTIFASAIDAIRLRPHHYVFVNWRNQSEEGTAVYFLKTKKSADALLSRLADATGRGFIDWFRVREAAKQ